MSKHCKREALMEAADYGLLHYGQVDPLLHFLEERAKKSGVIHFNGTTVLFYLGGMLAIAACTLFSTLAVEKWGMAILLDLSLIYLLCMIALASWMGQKGHAIPAGIFATLAIALVPMAVFALQHVLGFWAETSNAAHYRDFHRWIDWRWLMMELSTLLVAAIMLWRFRYSFLVMPVAVTLFYMGMDIVPAWLMQGNVGMFTEAGWLLRKQITLGFGVLMLLLALVVDLRSRSGKDYAFWLYLFGTITFWGALSSLGNGALSGKLIYLAINLSLILIAAMLSRRVFAVFGGLGVAMVLGDLSWNLFKDSIAFVALLTLLGFALIGAGIWWSKHEHRICARLRHWLPEPMQNMLVWRQ